MIFLCCSGNLWLILLKGYKTENVQLDEEAKNILMNYPFPGNVRELKNLAEQVSVLSHATIGEPLQVN